ncbi:hypothetical protein [Psychrobacter sp. DM8]|uniref:hypothetical protein n=1 Tax=Psychrobacter sp. DM8 TaxID=3440636 RepID=UPI003F500F62
MYNTHHSLYSYFTSMSILRVLIFIVCVTLLFSSQSSYALATNPGATCDAGFEKSGLDDSDYSRLASSLGSFVNVAGDAAGSIPLQIKMTITESNGPPTGNSSFTATTVSNKGVFNVFRDFPNMQSVTSIEFDFRNRITEQPIFLTNVALSAFDIDFANSSNGNSFDDYVLFTGVTANGSIIDGSYQAITDSRIRSFNDSRPNTPGVGLYILGNTSNCPANALGTTCQGSVQFSEPVKSVKVRYSNADFRIFNNDNPTNQQIFLSLDNYCYVPQYIFSGTVFNDNGGITDTQADANNANISSGTYSNRPNYFNGVFNPPQESGISGSTVRLANCANPGTTYPTQSVLKTGAPTGAYQISIPRTTLGNNTNLCLVESRTGNTYPIRTTSDSRNTGFSATTYNYPNNDFGRVIAENVALVLKKSQYINDCPATLNYAGINDAPTPLIGFSTAMIEGIAPGRCIAYKITATNRANIKIDNFIMDDVLQKKGTAGALVTSVLANPALATADYNISSSPAIGANGIVTTKSLVLPPRSKRDFYFNTKYGTSQ